MFVEPGGTSPVFASFRDRRAAHPLRLDYGTGELEIPELITPSDGASSAGRESAPG